MRFYIILACVYYFLEKSVYTQHGTLRGCAKLQGSFNDEKNCTTTKNVIIKI